MKKVLMTEKELLMFSEISPEETTIRIGRWDNKQKLGDLTDTQLKNIASWNHKTPTQKKNVRRNTASVIGSLGVASGLVGYSKSGLKGAAIGSILGSGVGSGIVIGGDRLHKKQAKAAEEVLKHRKQKHN